MHLKAHYSQKNRCNLFIFTFTLDKILVMVYNRFNIRNKTHSITLQEKNIVDSGEDDDNCRSTYIVLKKYIS